MFDHVVCNPPFYAAGRASASPDGGKAAAHGEGETPLQVWLDFCLRRTAPGGTVTVIHRAERLEALLLVGALATLVLWLMGLAAKARRWGRHFQANTERRRNVLAGQERKQEAVFFYEKGNAAFTSGKLNVSKIYYRMAANRAEGQLKAEILGKLHSVTNPDSLSAGVR